MGYRQRKNIFKISYGSKQYTGGDKADIFYLSKPDLLAEASYFNGLGGEDIIITYEDLPEHSHYFIDLTLGEIHFHHINDKKLIANIENIEHAYGNPKTNDELKGNHENNYLNGRGGNNQIWGYLGDDEIFVYQGNNFICGGIGDDFLSGGGDDIYLISYNDGHTVIEDTAEVTILWFYVIFVMMN
ncbi:calcium-binding protein [Candidatus Hamiltonella defensa]|uniref:calcium-binding protein n=1 Tax=Candidatus Williamhamiltonella defendens TaxID=138072 RepID=UPI001583D356|nr:calcium-binding protein [Candidatus Hamiltonella defensa]